MQIAGRFFLFFSLYYIIATEANLSILQLANSNEEIGRSIYNIIRSTPGNIFFSPISIEAVLAVLRVGAGGNTAHQIVKATSLDDSNENVVKVFEDFTSLIRTNNISGITLELATGVFTNKKHNVKQDFLELVKNIKMAELGSVDFSKSDEATDEINEWAAKKTDNKITELFSKGTLDPLTQLVLANAIYFKGNWLTPFKVSDTKKGIFHLNENKSKEVDFMTLVTYLQVRNVKDAYIVHLPYQGHSASMVLIVPKKINGLSAVEERIIKQTSSGASIGGVRLKVRLEMPKFKIEQFLELNDILKKMGMTEMFNDNADFSAISDDPLYVSNAIQKSFIEVNEEGSKAASATGIEKLPSSIIPPLKITLDRPFLFFIRHQRSGVILFIGRYSS